MECVRRHLTATKVRSVLPLVLDNCCLCQFFSSPYLDFDAPSDSLRLNIMKFKAKHIYDLASGATGDDEENAIRDLMVGSENSYELIRMIDAIGGWGGLDDELPENYLTQIAARIARVLDQRDYVVFQLIRRYLILLDYDACPNLGDCFVRLLQWPVQFQPPEIDLLLSRKDELLKGIASATLRERAFMVKAARIHPTVIGQYAAVAPYRANELIALIHEATYTKDICDHLQGLQYRELYKIIPDLVDPNLTDVRRFACRDTFERLALELAAAEEAVGVMGSPDAESLVDGFMTTLNFALENFPAKVPAPAIAQQIAQSINAAIGSSPGNFNALVQAMNNFTAAIGKITLGKLLNEEGDDNARALVGELLAQGALARASFEVKNTLINALLDGNTDDDDEQAILAILAAAREHDQAELYQLTASATWEALDFSIDWGENDQLQELLGMPV